MRKKDNDMELGEKLKLLRKRIHGYTLAQVNEKTKLSVSFLSDIERGRTKPSLDTLKKLAECYQISINDLLEDVEFGNQVTAIETYPPGFSDFLKDVAVSEDIKDLILQVERRSKKKAQTKDDWLQFYYSLKSILGE